VLFLDEVVDAEAIEEPGATAPRTDDVLFIE
jgi:hypothetical protein